VHTPLASVDVAGTALLESVASTDYLDAAHANPPLVPRDAGGRAL